MTGNSSDLKENLSDSGQPGRALDQPEREFAPTFEPDQIIGGKYKIIAFLGRGGVGSVYLVEHLFLKQQFALKVLDGKQVTDDAKVRRFQIEAKAAFTLDHPGLVKVHDFGVLESDQPYLVMEYVQGVNLTDFLKENGTLKPQMATLIFSELCAGLAHAHRKLIIHRDIKPSNIMLVDSQMPGTRGSAKIVDFGIAKLAMDEDGEIQALTRTGEIFGSPLYMSPEQCAGGTIDQRSDIYSFGCALFESLTGTPPHVGTNQLRTMMLHVNETAPLLHEASLGREYPQELERIVAKLLKIQPAERYQNFEEVARDLNNVYSKDLLENQDGKRVAGRVEETKRQPARENRSKKIEISPLQLGLGLTGAAVLSAAVTAGLMHFASSSIGRKDVSATAPASASATTAGINHAGSNDADSENADSTFDLPPNAIADAVTLRAKAAEDSKLVKRIASEIVSTGEFKGQRKFVFPATAIGDIIDVVHGRKTQAQGTVYFSPEIPLELASGGSYPDAFQHPELFEKIAPNEFVHLTVTAPSERNVGENVQPNLHDEAQKAAKIISAFTSSNKLEVVSLTNLVVNSEALSALDRMAGLKWFVVCQPPAVDLSGPKHPFFQKLAGLKVQFAKQTTQILSQVYGSKNLTNLIICLSTPLPHYLDKLDSCPNLRTIFLQGGIADANWQNDLKKIHSLAVLKLSDIPMTPEQIQSLLDSCPQLEELHLVGRTYQPIQESRRFASNKKISFDID